MPSHKQTTDTAGAATDARRQKRRFVRLDIFSPVEFSVLQIDADQRVRLHPQKRAGVLLNLSGGGVLIATADPVASGDLVIMKFDIKGFDSLTNVLGKVKRVEDQQEDERLVGIEFLDPEQLDDPALATALTRLSENPREFSAGLRRLISRYVFQRQVESGKE
jgi:c-di-GMP-binding flagellar brake protein YcgR